MGLVQHNFSGLGQQDDAILFIITWNLSWQQDWLVNSTKHSSYKRTFYFYMQHLHKHTQSCVRVWMDEKYPAEKHVLYQTNEVCGVWRQRKRATRFLFKHETECVFATFFYSFINICLPPITLHPDTVEGLHAWGVCSSWFL